MPIGELTLGARDSHMSTSGATGAMLRDFNGYVLAALAAAFSLLSSSAALAQNPTHIQTGMQLERQRLVTNMQQNNIRQMNDARQSIGHVDHVQRAIMLQRQQALMLQRQRMLMQQWQRQVLRHQDPRLQQLQTIRARMHYLQNPFLYRF